MNKLLEDRLQKFLGILGGEGAKITHLENNVIHIDGEVDMKKLLGCYVRTRKEILYGALEKVMMLCEKECNTQSVSDILTKMIF